MIRSKVRFVLFYKFGSRDPLAEFALDTSDYSGPGTMIIEHLFYSGSFN